MTKKYTQEEVTTYFKEHGYELLSDYKNNNTPVRVRNGNGEEYNVRLHNFKKGQRPERVKRKFTQEYMVVYFKEHGYELLSEYVDAHTKVTIRNSNGEEYDVAPYNFRLGRRPERRNTPLDKASIIKLLAVDGYHLVGRYPERSSSKFRITCPNAHMWEVTLNDFKTGSRCPECANLGAGHMSFGERLVLTVLRDNHDVITNIKREVGISIGGTKHRFDFMFTYNSHQYVVEYDGKQHYGDNRFFNSPKERDAQKDKYCKDKGITLIRIPYTVNTLPGVTKEINRYLMVGLTTPAKIHSNTIQDVVDYFLTHSAVDTSKKFLLHPSTVERYFKHVYGIGKKEYIRSVRRRSINT